MASKKKTATNKDDIDEEVIMVDVEEENEPTIEDLPGVGPATAEKLREAGFDDLLAVAVMSPSELADQAELGEAVSSKIIQGAKKLANIGGFVSGSALLDRRKQVQKLSSGAQSLDELLGGGFETQSICEVFGEFGSGKTQIGHQLAVNTLLPVDQGGLGGEVFYIDTEDTFRPERIAQMANGIESIQTRHWNEFVARAYNSAHQMLLVDEIKRCQVCRCETHHRRFFDKPFPAEYVGRGMLATRQQKLNRHLKELKQLSDVFNAIVLVTNQVMSKPDAMWGDPTKAIGGHIVGHASTFRLYLRKSKGGRRVARLIDSPNLPEGDAVISVTEDGIRD